MLRGLAEFAMSGRRQAATVAILFGLVPILDVFSAGVVALVTLSKGTKEGFLIALWATLPAGLRLIQGDFSPLFMLVAALVCAQVLRRTESWPKALVAITVIGLLAQLSLMFQTSYIEQARLELGVLMEMLKGYPELEGTITLDQLLAMQLNYYGFYQMLFFVISLVIGRHWQALLYNPAGFKTEFHAIRLPPAFAGVLVLMIAIGELGIAPVNGWVPVFFMAPLISGLAFCHYMVAQRNTGVAVLILSYMVAILFTPLMVVLGFIDSFADLRKRFTPQL